MHIVLVAALLHLLAAGSMAQAPSGLEGQLWVTTRSQVTVYLNGKEVLKATDGTGKSDAVALKPGDRLVLKLHKTGNGNPVFLMCALSTDESLLCNFRNTDFKVVPDVGLTDFADADFQGWKKAASNIANQQATKWKVVELPIKNYSEWMWGDANDCVIAAIITEKMFKKKPR
jgi:hypothetical protein